jgi:hypothetical protein
MAADVPRSPKPHPAKRKRRFPWSAFWAALAAIATVAAVVTPPTQVGQYVQARLWEPRLTGYHLTQLVLNGHPTTLSRYVTVTGTRQQSPEDYRFVIVRTPGGSFYPAGQPYDTSGNDWACDISLGRAGQATHAATYQVFLVVVPQSDATKFNDWIASYLETRSGGMKDLPKGIAHVGPVQRITRRATPEPTTSAIKKIVANCKNPYTATSSNSDVAGLDSTS